MSRSQHTAPWTLLKARLGFLAAFAVLFLAAVGVARSWGRDWALAAYTPVLLEQVNGAKASLHYGDAEAAVGRAVRTSPEYAYRLLDTLVPDLVVMPELAGELLRVYEHGMREQGRFEEAAVNAARVHFARGDHEKALNLATKLTERGLATRQVEQLRALSLWRLAQWPRLEPTLPALSKGNGVPAPGTAGGWYADLFEESGLGAWACGDAEPPPAAPPRNMAPDAAYRQGVLMEMAGDTQSARMWYEQAVLAPGAHLDAAAAYLRCTGNEAGAL